MQIVLGSLLLIRIAAPMGMQSVDFKESVAVRSLEAVRFKDLSKPSKTVL